MSKRDTESKPQKKVYKSPRLSMYGDIRTITQTVGNSGAGDGSGSAMLKTRP